MRKGQELLGVHICIYKKFVKKCFGSGFQRKFLSGVEHSANKETMPQVVAYKKLNTMENDKAKHWSRLLTRGGRIWRFDCNYGLA